MRVVQLPVISMVQATQPVTREELGRWVEALTGLRLPRAGICAGHQTPLDYLEHVFFERAGDPVVWACRGGGKTQIAAVATLLDLIFKPGIQVRILAGSFEQAEKMYGYLRRIVDGRFRHLLKEAPTRKRLALKNGSAVEVLAQSDRAVRGQRVQKVRCDEVELFARPIWQAAQLTTRSMTVAGKRWDAMRKGTDSAAGGVVVRGAVEAISTRHLPNGLMHELVEKAPNDPGMRLFQWCVWDIVERCEPARACEGCALWGDCGGRARGAIGFLPIEDLLAMRGRVARRVWETEMLCQRPRPEAAAFPGFTVERCVRARTMEEMAQMRGEWVGAVDFGMGTFVCLLMRVYKQGSAERVYVADEMVGERRALPENIRAMAARQGAAGEAAWPALTRVYCDVAGGQTNSHTGRTDIALLRAAGYEVACKYMEVEKSVERLDSFINPAEGASRLEIHPRCRRLVEALEGYQRDGTGKLVKDGRHDHCVDALRYGVCGAFGMGWKTEWRMY